MTPTRIQMDPGTENTVVADIQMHLRRNHDDVHAGKESVAVKDSKLNQVGCPLFKNAFQIQK